MTCLNLDIGIEAQGTLSSNHSFWLADMLFLEEELAVQIADINRVKINLGKQLQQLFLTATMSG